MDPMEPTDSLPFASDSLAEAKLTHLPPSNDPMLLSSQGSNRMVVENPKPPMGRFRP